MRYFDQYYCSRCGRTWDVDDTEPPDCKSGHDMFIEMRDELKRINEYERAKRGSNR